MKVKLYATLAAALLLIMGGVAFAQTATPPAPTAATMTAPPKKDAAPTKDAPLVAAKPAATDAGTAPATLPSGLPDIKPPAAPAGTDDIVSLLKAIMAAGKEGKWALLVGLLIMLLTRVVDWAITMFFKKKINQKAMPWIAIALGVAGQVAFQLAAGGAWLDAILGGISLGVGAAGTYSAIGRYLPAMRTKTGA